MKKLLFIFSLLISFLFANSSNAFITLWKTTKGDNNITIPTNPKYKYNYSVDWGDGSVDKDVKGNITHTYKSAGEHIVKINGNFSAIFFNCAQQMGVKVFNTNKIYLVKNWGNIEWKNFEGAFCGCENINFDAKDRPNLSKVESFESIFNSAINFNSDINSWDVSSVKNFSKAFLYAKSFNKPLDNWNVSSATNMYHMFDGTHNFSQPLNSWNVSKVTTMEGMFFSAFVFNQPLNNWDVSSVESMDYMFKFAQKFNQDLSSWRVKKGVKHKHFGFGSKIKAEPKWQ